MDIVGFVFNHLIEILILYGIIWAIVEIRKRYKEKGLYSLFPDLSGNKTELNQNGGKTE